MSKNKKPIRPQDKEDLLFGLPALRLEAVPESFRPFCEFGMKVHSDALELWSYRARAWMDWPGTFTACKTLDELTKAQNEYFAQMQRDYAHFADGMLRRAMIEQDTLDDQGDDVEEKLSVPEETTLHKAA